MTARGGMWNPSMFIKSGEDVPSFEEQLKSYVRSAVRVNGNYQNTKWVLNEMLTAGATVIPPGQFLGSRTKDFKHKLGQSKSMAAICEMFGEPYKADDFPSKAHTTTFYRETIFDEAIVASEGASKDAHEAELPEVQGR